MTLPGIVAGLAAAFLAAAAAAAPSVVKVSPGGLAAALRDASPGAIVELAPGRYEGGVVIEKPLLIRGQGVDGGSVIDGGGNGRVVTIDAPDVVLQGVTVRGSGISLFDEDAGVYLTKNAAGAVIEDNFLTENLIGVAVKGATDAIVRRNRIHGRRDLRMSERGNAIYVWNAPGTEVVENDVRFGRDGIFVTTSRDNRFAGNTFRDLRFAVHYMYTQSSDVVGNTSAGNHVGYALMYSKNISVRDNLSTGDRDHGVLLNYVNNSEIGGNAVLGGGEKCVFIYNSNVNDFNGNWFEGCGIGIHFTAGSERNRMSGNAFIGNRTQVKYVGTRHLDWSADGRGQYWSDNPAFDLDGDGLSDRSYRPNDMVDQVVWAHPVAKLLLNGPAVTVLRYAQTQLPSLHPGGVVDSAPLMRPPEVAARGRPGPVEEP